MIHVGVDLHQRFCYMTALEARGKIVQAGPVTNEKLALRKYFRQFRGQSVQVAVEACGFWPAFREVVEPEVKRLVLVHPQRVKAIASAKLKNDRVDSETLAHLLRCDLLPESWKADRETQARRQQVRLRATLVRQRTRLKNQVHAVLHQQGLRSPVTDLFGKRGRLWLGQVKLPPQARESVATCLRMIDHYGEEIQKQNLQLGEKAKQDRRVRWLTTIPGIGEVSAMMVLAEIGDLGRFSDKEALCSYAGLVPRVRESAGKAARSGITRQGSPWLRWMLVEAAQVATRTSPAAKRYYERLLRKKHKHVARVALARKLLIAVYAMLHDGVVFDEEKFAAR
ncbi:MAG TPA: IS110 family transposase [Candidatus Sulfotelmatobacter sp.]|nr:IS110 family transposase [Candidatus Sulfotelmatobacter sp.]